MQREFNFTEVGAIQEYNNDQIKFMYAGYRNHLLMSGQKGEPELWVNYQMNYVLSGQSAQFASNYRDDYFYNTVERQTAEAKRKWDNHGLIGLLQDLEPMYLAHKGK